MKYVCFACIFEKCIEENQEIPFIFAMVELKCSNDNHSIIRLFIFAFVLKSHANSV